VFSVCIFDVLVVHLFLFYAGERQEKMKMFLFRLAVTIIFGGLFGMVYPVVVAHMATTTHAPVISIVSLLSFLAAAVVFVLTGFSKHFRLVSILCAVAFAAMFGVSYGTETSLYKEQKIDELLHKNAGVALVTGSTRGMGVDVVHELVEAGWTVFLHGRSSASMRGVQKQLPKGPGKTIALDVGADLTSFSEVNSFADAVLAHPLSEKLSLLILNAGMGGLVVLGWQMISISFLSSFSAQQTFCSWK
jgi:hypothetical protein